MKKLLILLLVVALCATSLVVFAGCNTEAEIAMITDVGTINDGSFNQNTWEGVQKYARDNSKTYKYYRPAADTDTDRAAAIELAISNGAVVVVCPGYLFETVVKDAAAINPTVKFIVLDVAVDAPNVYSILFDEVQSGFLAGYAAVKQGYTKLGFIGGMAVPAVVNYGYGFAQGANFAATEMSLANGSIALNYWYSGVFGPNEEITAKAEAWYTTGTQVIFACGGKIYESVVSAIGNKTDRKMIGVDSDQVKVGSFVITSAMKLLDVAVYDALTDFYADSFKGGETAMYDVSNHGVGLPTNLSRMDKVTKTIYDAIYSKLVANTAGTLFYSEPTDWSFVPGQSSVKTLADRASILPKLNITVV